MAERQPDIKVRAVVAVRRSLLNRRREPPVNR